MNPISFDDFLHQLQRVLQALYDPTELRKSPLVALFGLEGRPNPALALQDAVQKAIQSLRPRPDVPLQSNAWRLYNVLTYRYAEQTGQAQVAEMMGLSVRQLRREEREAERLLAEVLWKKFNLTEPPAQPPTASPAEEALPATPDHTQELEWLSSSFPSGAAAVTELVAAALKLAQPLLDSLGKRVECQIPEALPPVSGQLAAMRQSLLNLLLAGLRAAGDALALRVEATPQGLALTLWAEGGAPAPQSPPPDDLIEMARKFSELFNGQLQVTLVPFRARLLLPVSEQIPILVIDDNADVLRLLQRYLTGTAYSFNGLNQPELALETALALAPRLIVMDVMMPGLDDWELLGRLRSHPALRAIPIIACTILPQEQLALALGATGFLRKPVNRQAFLAELDRLTAPAAQKQP